THLPKNSDYSGLYKKIKEAFADVELIIHAGDVTNIDFITDLEKIAPVKAVCGNVDDSSIRDKFKDFEVFEQYNIKIGISHKQPSMSFLKQENIKILISGHTHVPGIHEHDENGHGILLLNPGSPTQPRSPPARKMYSKTRVPQPSVIILDIDEEISSAYIVSFKI
ncbi:MAG: metallophosphoesterase family protein, partial [archaeon]|nr:metallophosphoesterase family protein [archaeon]